MFYAAKHEFPNLQLHSFQMMEDGEIKAAAPECRSELGWIYHAGHCYMFTSYHVDFLTVRNDFIVH